MFQNLQNIPSFQKKDFMMMRNEDPFFQQLESLLPPNKDPSSSNLGQMKRVFEKEDEFMRKVNEELAQENSEQQQEEKNIADQFEISDSDSIVYVYICFK